MNNNKSESQELLRLFKCAVDTGTEVLSAFAGSKLLPTYNGCFIRFLDDKKHQIFHLWQSKKLLCCACPASGCNIKRTGHMDNWIFKKLYDDNGNEDRRHIVRNSGRVEQLCLHKYITRNIAIHELDISAISFLLRSLAPLSQNETTALDTVTTYRSQICHAHSMKCYSITELNKVWNELENALVDLVDPFYKRMVRNQIKDLRKFNFEKEEITDLLKKVDEVKTDIIEVKNSMSSNINAFTKSEENLKTMVTEEALEMKQAQQVILQEVISSKSIVKESGDNMLEQFGILNTNQAEMRGQLKEIVKMVHQITNTTISLKYEQSIDLSEGEECLVLWQLATPANWNPKEIEQILNESQERFKDLPMKIKFVRNGSLVLMTTIAAKDLKESTTFQTAVKAFLTRMVEVCNIDTTIKCNVDVTLHILKSDEVKCRLPNVSTDNKAVQTCAECTTETMNVTCKLPSILIDDNVVQTEDTDDEHKIRMKKHWNETEKFDLAFLNSDSQREIEWIQKTSEVLKAKYDLKCAVPSNDYLYGLPLKDKLLRYLDKFQAVILTVTEENHKQYEDYMDKDISLIVVELDYISSIRTKVRQLPYINCTICEHQWFPRLINILKTKLPDNLGKQMENITVEQEEHCEKCKTSCMTAVYHKVEIRINTDYDTRRFVIFCGSLNDEAWIMDFLNQKTECMKPYGICLWDRALESTFVGENYSKVCICVSPNLQKCPSIGEYVKGLGNDTTITFYLLKIEQSDIPRFLGHLPNLIDATTINKKELAHKLFPPAAENVVLYVMNMFDNRKVFLVGEIEANKWIQDNIGNINSLFVDISKSGFQERKNTNITEMEYNYDVNALILVTTSVNEENSEANFLAKRFTCWSHCVTIRLTNKSKGSEVGDPNLRFIDDTCGYEEWSLKLKEEVKDQLISGFRLSFKVPKDSREYLLKKDNISVGFLGSIDDRMWIDEAMLILNSPNFSPCPFVLEEVKHVQVYADMMIIFVPIYLRNGSHLHRIITENKKSTIIPVLKKGTAPLDVFASLETITYERHTWFDYIKEALYQRILYNCVMTQSEKSVLLVGSIKDFPFIESAVLRLQLSSYEIDQKKLTKTLKLGTKSATVLFLSRGITKDFELNPYKLKKTTLITILTERMKIPVVLESTTRLEAFSGENQWLERLPNLVKKVQFERPAFSRLYTSKEESRKPSLTVPEVKEKQTLPILGRKTEESSTHSTDAQVLGRRREELSTPFTDIYGDQSSKEKFKPEDFTKDIDLYLEKEKMSHPEMKFVTKGDQSLDDEDKLEEPLFYAR